ncbi:MAG: hypothetical protein H7141_02140 [Burkholderiales bacterium]|nr:hypothetical protein [Bacteroidia bacterium]
MKKYICVILFTAHFCYSQTVTLPHQSFGKGVTVLYIGSGALSRHFDTYKFKQETTNYKRLPFISIGVDRCIYPYASNAYWGLGPYLSSWVANREYVDAQNSRKENVWSNSLIAIRATHHNSFFVRKNLDMCSGILVGVRIKYYHSKTVNGKDITPVSDRSTILPAFGITATIRYYFYKDFGVYFEGCLGYKTNLASIGLIYKIY